MLWMIAYAIDELIWLEFTGTDVVNGGEQWESEKIKRDFFMIKFEGKRKLPG